jgi:hypothetical protein
VVIKKAAAPKTSVQIPKDASGKTIHVILTLRDDGNPQLTSYRRIVIKGMGDND